ncbi:MAG: carboxypeptidase-like regulatory domain-containing protein [Nitrososphaerota archaeon]
MQKKTLILLTIFSLFLILNLHIANAEENSLSLKVLVIDQNGIPQGNMDVLLENKTYVHRFLTNSSGWAEFKDIGKGKYNISVLYEGLRLNTTEVSFPEENEVVLIVPFGSLTVTIVDLDGKPLKNKEVTLKCPLGNFTKKGETNSSGIIVFEKLPYSILERIDKYVLEVYNEGYLVASRELYIPVGPIKLTANLVNINISVVNLEGRPIDKAKVMIYNKGKNVSRTLLSVDGKVSFEQIPSSSIENVGEYRINVEVNGGIVYNETKIVDKSISLNAICEVGRIITKVVDSDQKPLKNVTLVFSHRYLSNFKRINTDINGEAKIEEMPLSKNVGEYFVKVLRGGEEIIEANLTLASHEEVKKIIVPLKEVKITILDRIGKPIENAKIKLTDKADIDRIYESITNSDGTTILKLLYGGYDIIIIKNNITVFQEKIKIDNPEKIIENVNLNIPIEIFIKDFFGNNLEEAYVKIDFNEENIFSNKMMNNSLKIIIPYPGKVKISISINNEEYYTDTFYIEGPLVKNIILKPIVKIFNSIIKMDILIIFLISISFFIIFLIYLYPIITRKKRLIRK